MIVRVDSPDDPRIADYREVKERDRLGRGGVMVEGEVVLRKAAHGRHPLRSLLIAESRVEPLSDLIDGLDLPVHVAPQAVMDAIVGFPIHRGVLAYAERAPEPSPAALLEGQSLVVALYGVANHDNMGGVFRNAAAFGAGAVLLDPTSCDPLYRKAIRTSVGASLLVPFARAADPVAALEAAGLVPIALSPSGETPLHALERPERTALVLGAEGPGLPAEVMACCRTVSIPMSGGFDSLNLATTSGIALYALTAPRPTAP
jgi:tRNA G18 (ribose-2'-O)-methylase SpoU